MALVKVWVNGEDLTAGKGTLIEFSKVREIESMGFAVEIIDRKGE